VHLLGLPGSAWMGFRAIYLAWREPAEKPASEPCIFP